MNYENSIQVSRAILNAEVAMQLKGIKDRPCPVIDLPVEARPRKKQKAERDLVRCSGQPLFPDAFKWQKYLAKIKRNKNSKKKPSWFISTAAFAVFAGALSALFLV